MAKTKMVRLSEKAHAELVHVADTMEKVIGKRPSLSVALEYLAKWGAESVRNQNQAGIDGWLQGVALMVKALSMMGTQAGVFHSDDVRLYFQPKMERMFLACSCPKCLGSEDGGKYSLEVEKLVRSPSVQQLFSDMRSGALKFHTGHWPPPEEFGKSAGNRTEQHVVDALRLMVPAEA